MDDVAKKHLGAAPHISFALLFVFVSILPGCNTYGWLVFKENMLTPTPDMIPTTAPSPSQWKNDELTVSWIGHSTVLINFHGTTILTDPVLGNRIAPPEMFGSNLGIRRITRPALSFDQLPPIDLVLLSHAHYDHWDKETLRRFTPHTCVIIPKNTMDLVPEDHFGAAMELPWGQSTTFGNLTITAIQVEHWGQRNDETIWRGFNGYVISGHNQHIFFAGDTAYNSRINGAPVNWPARLGQGPYDLCIIPIGDSYFRYNHISPEEGWDLFNQIHGKYFLPVHWRTFILTPRDKEATFEPMERLKEAAGEGQGKIVCQEPGETFVVPAPRRSE